MQPKYSINEIERRWLVSKSALADLLHTQPVRITDKYLDAGRLRLRKIESDTATTVFKLCKKYGNREGACEAITNLYLDVTEYGMLNSLPGSIIEKLRYRVDGGSIDVFKDNAELPAIFEIEFADTSQAAAYSPPEYVEREVTGVQEYSGAYLARNNRP